MCVLEYSRLILCEAYVSFDCQNKPIMIQSKCSMGDDLLHRLSWHDTVTAGSSVLDLHGSSSYCEEVCALQMVCFHVWNLQSPFLSNKISNNVNH